MTHVAHLCHREFGRKIISHNYLSESRKLSSNMVCQTVPCCAARFGSREKVGTYGIAHPWHTCAQVCRVGRSRLYKFTSFASGISQGILPLLNYRFGRRMSAASKYTNPNKGDGS